MVGFTDKYVSDLNSQTSELDSRDQAGKLVKRKGVRMGTMIGK